ncbi:FAD-dependent oxidoreductase, partial [Chloroflexota bacterium]
TGVKMKTLNNLFKPIKIGALELNNRIIMAPMGLNFVSDGKVTDRLINFYAARAKGGTGLIISSAVVNYYGPRFGEELHSMAPLICDDIFIPGIRQLAEAIHQNESKIALQLQIFFIWKKTADSAPEVVGPSAMPERPGIPETRAVSEEEIQQLVELCGDGARRAREAGIDAVEFHAIAAESLVAEFLSPIRNQRTDKYGGSLENRARFLLECIENARRKAGDDYTLLCRYSGEDFVEGGMTLEEAKSLGTMLERAGVHALDVSTGLFESPVPFIQRWVPPGHFIYLAEAVKDVVGIPVIGGTRINDPILADSLIAKGRVDMVYMSRPLIADPDLPNKAREGHFADIRYCTACCRCLDNLVGEGRAIECSVNPQAGREAEYVIEAARENKKVLVIGSGPAGMEAARVAALRGHTVTLCDNGRKLGGALLLAGVLNPELPRFLKYKARQVRRLPIDIKLNTDVTAAFIERMKPDEIILAAGGKPCTLEIPGVQRDNVLNGHDVLEAMIHPLRKGGVGQRLLWRLGSLFLRYLYNPALIRWGLRFGFPFKKRVVIIGGGFHGCELADVLAEKGKNVTILEKSRRMGYDIGPVTRWVFMKRLREFGVKMERNANVVEITGKGVRASVNDSETFFEADTVVLAMPLTVNDKLAQELEGKEWTVHSIGDCAEPAWIREAIASGFRVGNEI